jgi:predicted permease
MAIAIESVGRDVRYALRRLARTPGFTCIAIVTLALGVGVNTAFFSVVNGVIFRPLPVARVDRLVNIAATEGGNLELNRGLDALRLSRLIERKPQFVRDFFTVHNFQTAFDTGGAASLVMGEAVSGNYFQALGLRPLAGRLLDAGDDLAGANGPVVLSAHVWARDFGRDPAAVGRVIGVSGIRLTVVGVAPDGFTGMTAPNIFTADLWAPQNSIVPLVETPGNTRGGLHFRAFARLHESATMSRADAEMRRLGVGIDPADDAGGLAVVPASKGMLPVQLATLQAVIGTLLVALSSLVLLIACANLSGLVSTRVSGRTSEIAVRMAIGAERRHLVQMQLVETSLLAGGSGFVGFAFAWSLTRLAGLLPIPEMGGVVMRINATPDLRVFFFALLAAAGAAALVGWSPAMRAAEIDPMQAWSASGGTSGQTRRGSAATTRLIAFQVGASLAMLLVATLFVRSAIAAASYDVDVDLARITGGHVNLAVQKIPDARGSAVFERLLAANTPDGQALALASGVPIAGNGRLEKIRVDGQLSGLVTHSLVVSPNVFAVLRIQLVQGRTFTDRDAAGSPNVAVVNETLASDLWPGKDPIGRSFSIPTSGSAGAVTVVGIVRESDHTAMDRRDRRYMFLPLRQNYLPQMTVLTAGNSSEAADRLKAAVASATPEVAVFDVKPLAALIGFAVTGSRFAAATIGAAGLLGFVIAMVGLYGTVSFVVGERTREFGIMRALGADGRHIQMLVMRDATRMLGLGVMPGLLITFLLAGFLRSWLLGLPPHDPVTFVAVPGAMLIVGFLAALIPARRASRVDPMQAIRRA